MTRLGAMHNHLCTKLLRNIAVCIFSDAFNYITWWMPQPMDNMATIFVTKLAILLTLSFLYHSQGSIIQYVDDKDNLNDRPVIGVLSQEQSKYLDSKFPEQKYTSYIAASYVKAVEASGARVVPILIGKDRNYYEDLMNKINGALFPGGATFFNQSNGYADAGQHIFDIAKKINDAGDYFPIFGTCLGFELLIVIDSGREHDSRVSCHSFDSRPLEFTQDFRNSKMYRNAPNHIVRLLTEKNLTVNAHQFCIVDKNSKTHKLSYDWQITSYSYDEQGFKFISSVEHRRYPFYGVQFHPEKSSFEWKITKKYPHTEDAVIANRYFMDFFVEECRKNTHVFKNIAEENRHLIYNYPLIFTGSLGSQYEQCYFFEPAN